MNRKIISLIGSSATRSSRTLAIQAARTCEKRQNEFIRGILTESLNREAARESFEILDQSRDENLTIKEIGILFGDDVRGLEKFVEKLFHYVPIYQQNMTFPDFLILMSQRTATINPNMTHPVRELFNSYDITKNGNIDKYEMKEWMGAHGKFLTDAQAQGIIDKVDQKDDGVIDYAEFLMVFARKILISKLNLN
jgi:Ca2+-binding EF-hand superfamily protein